MCGDRLRDAAELNENGALTKTFVIDLCRNAACQDAPARALKSGASELGISSKSFRVADGMVCGNPIRFGHGKKIAIVVEGE